MRRTITLIIAIVVAFAPCAPFAHAAQTPRVPGFLTLDEQPGVTVFKRANRDYVQVIDPTKGGHITLLSGEMVPSEGSYTQFRRQTPAAWWQQWSVQEPGAVATINGQFFDPHQTDRAPLAFSVKIAGTVHTGYGDTTEYRKKKRVLFIHSDGSAQMQSYSDDAAQLFADTTANAIVGLIPDVVKQDAKRIPRTFIATSNGQTIIFSSSAANQRYAVRILRAFGATRTQMMMLDGGSSAQLMHNGVLLVPHLRGRNVAAAVPQIIGISATTEEKR